MTFEIEAGGTIRHVEGRGRQLFVDGRRVEVDAVKVGHAWSLLVAHRSYEVFLDARAPGELVAHVNGRAVTVRGGLKRFGARRVQKGSAETQTQRNVTAPMPGRVARVLVKVGDLVNARQGLVVVEAMKMENELRSPRAGTVVEVRASEGALVDANSVLVVIE